MLNVLPVNMTNSSLPKLRSKHLRRFYSLNLLSLFNFGVRYDKYSLLRSSVSVNLVWSTFRTIYMNIDRSLIFYKKFLTLPPLFITVSKQLVFKRSVSSPERGRRVTKKVHEICTFRNKSYPWIFWGFSTTVLEELGLFFKFSK